MGFHGNKDLPKSREKFFFARTIFEGVLRQNVEPMPCLVYSRSFGIDDIQCHRGLKLPKQTEISRAPSRNVTPTDPIEQICARNASDTDVQ